jgi:hypothetical protein
MIRLKSIIKESHLDELRAHDRSIQEWTGYWFRTSRLLKQRAFAWNQRGIITDEQKADVGRQLDRLAQFFKKASIQSRRLLRAGSTEA